MSTVIPNGLAHLNHKKKRHFGAFFIKSKVKMLHSILANIRFHLRNFVILDLLKR